MHLEDFIEILSHKHFYKEEKICNELLWVFVTIVTHNAKRMWRI